MRSDGLWNAELVGRIVGLRHTETLVIADAGLPVPTDVPVIDLGWRRNSPRVSEVLPAVLGELVIDRASMAKELNDDKLRAFFIGTMAPTPLDWITHDELKGLTADAAVVVRTGDATPYVNVALHAGVPFGDRR